MLIRVKMVGVVGGEFVWKMDRKLESRAEGQPGCLSSHAMATDDEGSRSLTFESGLARHTLSTVWALFKTLAAPLFVPSSFFHRQVDCLDAAGLFTLPFLVVNSSA